MDTVVAVAVGLVNSLTPGDALGRPYQPPSGGELSAAIATALAAGHTPRIPDSAVTPEQAAEFGRYAAALREVFDATTAGQVDRAARLVNELLADTGARPALDRHDGEPWHLHFHGTDSSMVTGWAAGCATGLAVVLGTGMQGRLGVCTAPRCDRVYVDTSRNGTRRFCSTTCQNRVKAAAFRAKGG